MCPIRLRRRPVARLDEIKGDARVPFAPGVRLLFGAAARVRFFPGVVHVGFVPFQKHGLVEGEKFFRRQQTAFPGRTRKKLVVHQKDLFAPRLLFVFHRLEGLFRIEIIVKVFVRQCADVPQKILFIKAEKPVEEGVVF